MIWEYIERLLTVHESSYIFDKENRATYYELKQIVKQKGDYLKNNLISKSKCAILCKSNYKTAIAILSCWYADLIPIPISKNYGNKHCENILHLTEPDLIITDELSLLDCGKLFTFDIDNCKYYGKISKKPPELSLANVAIIMCTSGTTGNPKGSMMTDEGLIKNVISISKYFKITPNDTILISRPLYHCAALIGELIISFFSGTNVCFIDEVFNPAAIINYIKKYNITVLCGTPTLFSHISAYFQNQGVTADLRLIAISGECLLKNVAKKIRQVFPNTNIYNIYGLTEAGPRVSYLSSELFDDFPESVGIPLDGIEVEIVNSNFEVLSKNQIGMIIIKSPSIMKGYYSDIEMTSHAIKDGWLISGDLGYKDENGYLYIKSRIDDMIIKAGMNIYPKEIENILNQSEIFKDVVVYGLKSNIGQTIAINVVLSPENKSLCSKEIMDIISDMLPSFQMPSQINIVESLERNASGKIVRPKDNNDVEIRRTK